MRIESAVTSISWIPSEAVEGLPKVPFTMGVAHYDEAPPDRLVDIDSMHRADLFREANELKAWIEVKDGMICGHGQSGGGRIGITRLKVGPKELRVPAVALPTIQHAEPGDGFVRFTQTARGRAGAPAPRSVRGKPYFQWHSAIAWTTLELTIQADGATEHEFVGARPFRGTGCTTRPARWSERAARSTSTSGTASRTRRTRRGAPRIRKRWSLRSSRA